MRFGKVVARVSDSVCIVSIFSLLLLTGIVTVEVVSRYFLNRPIDWADEIASYALLLTVFSGLAYTLKEGGHIQITLITDYLPPQVKAFLDKCSYIIGVIFSTLFLIACVSRFSEFWVGNVTSYSTLYMPLWIPGVFLIIGSSMFFVQMLALAILALTRTKLEHEEEVPNGRIGS